MSVVLGLWACPDVLDPRVMWATVESPVNLAFLEKPAPWVWLEHQVKLGSRELSENVD